HLFAGIIALGLAAITFFAAQRVLIHLEHATIVSTAPERFALKNQGLAFQRAAAHSSNVLMIYGSSELLMPAAPERGNIVFGTALDFGLKRDIAARMLQFPETLEQRPFLEFALKRLASGQLLDRVVFCALWPAGKIQTALYELEDHWAAVHHIQRQTKPPP